METVTAVAFLVTSLLKSSSLLLNMTSNPAGCSGPTSNGTCAMKVLACKLPAGCPAPSGSGDRALAVSPTALACRHHDVPCELGWDW